MSLRAGAVALVAVVSFPALAQTDAERARMDYERQQREYWRKQEEQRMEQQCQQQIYDEQRRRDEESSRNAFTMGGGQPNDSAPMPRAGSSGGP